MSLFGPMAQRYGSLLPLCCRHQHRSFSQLESSIWIMALATYDSSYRPEINSIPGSEDDNVKARIDL